MITKGTHGWDVDFWLDRSAGIRKRKKAFRTKSEAERWIIDGGVNTPAVVVIRVSAWPIW